MTVTEVIDTLQTWIRNADDEYDREEMGRVAGLKEALHEIKKTGHCKDCKYFEYDSGAKVDGIPLIVAHEVCKKWARGCKTRADGYCFLFEPQGSEVEE